MIVANNFDLPAALREIADVIGRETALSLAGHYLRWDERDQHYGVRGYLYVPKPERLKGSHRLVSILGLEVARQLSETFGGETLNISAPTGLSRRNRDARIIEMSEAGFSDVYIAAAMGMCERNIRTIRANHGIRKRPQPDRLAA